MLQFWGGIPHKQTETLNSYVSVQNCSFGRQAFCHRRVDRGECLGTDRDRSVSSRSEPSSSLPIKNAKSPLDTRPDPFVCVAEVQVELRIVVVHHVKQGEAVPLIIVPRRGE